MRSDPRNLPDDMAAVMSRADEVISPGRGAKLEQLEVSELSPDRFELAIRQLLEGELLHKDEENFISLTDSGRAWLAEELGAVSNPADSTPG